MKVFGHYIEVETAEYNRPTLLNPKQLTAVSRVDETHFLIYGPGLGLTIKGSYDEFCKLIDNIY